MCGKEEEETVDDLGLELLLLELLDFELDLEVELDVFWVEVFVDLAGLLSLLPERPPQPVINKAAIKHVIFWKTFFINKILSNICYRYYCINIIVQLLLK